MKKIKIKKVIKLLEELNTYEIAEIVNDKAYTFKEVPLKKRFYSRFVESYQLINVIDKIAQNLYKGKNV